MASQLGVLFRVATFGESHGGGVGVVVDGCPPRLEIGAEEIQRDLDRHRPGQSRLTTPRQEADRVEILSGVFEGRTLGTPIGLLVRNQDARPAAYEAMKDVSLTARDKRWFEGRNLPLPERANESKVPSVAAE